MPRKAASRGTAPPAPAAPLKKRRALTHVGGKVEVRGDDAAAVAAVRRALEVAPDERATNAHVHGFHSYPARLHPETAERLIAALSRPGQTVLDPFCGSGTVLVEARLQGRRGLGVDANPLAAELAWLKSRGAAAVELTALRAAAAAVADAAEDRRLAKAGPKQRYAAPDLEAFEIHVLLELDGLRSGIGELEDEFCRRALGLVLSSLLTKFSRRAGDTSARTKRGRYAGGLVIRFFRKKVDELCARLQAFTERLPGGAPPAVVSLGDARELRNVPAGSVDLVVTSPPYPGVYDYYAHHALRLRWLGLPAKFLETRELGSRRELARIHPDAAVARWQKDFGRCLESLRRVLGAEGRAALLIADSVAGGRALYVDDLLVPLAERWGFVLLAHGAQVRPHFHGGTRDAFRARARREHLFVLAARGAAISGARAPGARRSRP